MNAAAIENQRAAILTEAQLDQMEPFDPLRVYVCEQCLLVQLPVYVGPADIFSEYAYFSSYSDTWVDHAHRYATMAQQRLPRAWSSSWPAMTVTFCSISYVPAFPFSASSRQRT
jgi:hypothetical protein